MYLKLYQVKKHLNINEDFRDDDEYLMQLAEVAETIVSRSIDAHLSGLEDGNGEIPAPLLQAILFMVGNYYANRESVAFAASSEVPKTFGYIIDLYRDYKGRDSRKEACLKCKLEENKRQQAE